MTAEATVRTVSIDAERPDQEGVPLADRIGGDDPMFDQVECLTAIEGAFPSLPAAEQTVVRLHFGDDMTQRQIAARMGVSRSQVGRLLGSAIEHLRAAA
jgi:RNA polymerase sigma-B factor